MNTIIFRSAMGSSLDILEGMKWSKEDMIKKGLLTDETTFEDISNHAGKHIIISESDH